jgi:Na+/melibiose symporter-like transporter
MGVAATGFVFRIITATVEQCVAVFYCLGVKFASRRDLADNIMKKEPSAVSTEDVRRRPHLRGTKNHGGIIGRLLLPTSFSPQNGGNDVTGGIDVSLMAALICLVILMVLLFVVCWFCERRRSASRREALTRVQARRQAAAEASADPKLRSKVLQALFPERTVRLHAVTE